MASSDADVLERFERTVNTVENLALVVEQLAIVVEQRMPQSHGTDATTARSNVRLAVKGAGLVAEQARDLLEELAAEWGDQVRRLPVEKSSMVLVRHEDLLDPR